MGEIEVKKKVPVIAEVDVLVAGGGLAGCVAAVTAARNGASVMLVERFGCLGGNMGPGMFSGGVLHLCGSYPDAFQGGMRGIPGEFVNRCEGYAGGLLGRDYFRDSQVVSYIWLKMMEENSVALLLNAWVSDPIMEGNRVAGLLVENKTGAQAIRAKAVIDATGDADVAARAGGLMDDGSTLAHSGMYFAMADIDAAKYQEWLEQNKTPEEDVAWAADLGKRLGAWGVTAVKPFLPLYRRAWGVGEYRFLRNVDDIATIVVDHGFYAVKHGNIVGGQVGMWSPRIRSGDAAQATVLENAARSFIFETAQFHKRHVPGWENSYLHMISPYFHCRGGRSAVCDYDLTEDDMKNGRRFADVMLVAHSIREHNQPEGTDFPYRQFLPRGVEGLLMAGRSGIIQPPINRDRYKVLRMGQAAGVAAAVAAKSGVTPRQVNVREVQGVLYHKHCAHLGPMEHLRELGIVQ